MESLAGERQRWRGEDARVRAPRSAGEPTPQRSETPLPRPVLELVPLDKRPRLPRLRASSLIPRLRHKLHSDCRLNARITTIRILVRIFVQYLTTLRTQKLWRLGVCRIRQSNLPLREGGEPLGLVEKRRSCRP